MDINNLEDYRKKYGYGIPVFDYPVDELLDFFTKIKDSPVQSGNYLLPEKYYNRNFNKYIIKENVYYNFVYMFFPNYFEVTTKKYEPLLNVFLSDKRLQKSLDKYFIFNRTREFRLHTFMKAVNLNSNVYRAGNFSPIIARHIYKNFTTENDKIFDFSAGFGGRLLGALACPHPVYYEGIDPNIKTIEGLSNLESFIKKYDNQRTNYGVKLIKTGIEDYIVTEPNTFSLAFSSPPYFDLEIYDKTDPKQASNLYKTTEDFVTGFLGTVVDKSASLLKPGGYFVINLKDNGKKSLITLFFKLMKKKPFKECPHILLLTNSLTYGTATKKEIRVEVLLIFKKNLDN